MYIKRLKLNNFRNYEQQDIVLDNKINVFYGDNAQGKTNILESIYMCAMAKSFRAKKDKELIYLGKDEAKIEIEFEKKDRDKKILIDLSNKKNIYVNDIKIKKLSELIGNLNIVMFSPDDILILKNGPEARRKFLNIMISQLRPNYIYNLNAFLKTLEQRNNYLKQIKYENKDKKILSIWNEKLAMHAEIIARYRKEFIDKIIDKIETIHKVITEEKEDITIKYKTECLDKNDYIELLNKTELYDIQKGYTSKGIHKDDFEVFINNKPVSIYGSQGQHRTAILSLKLSELQIIYDEIG